MKKSVCLMAILGAFAATGAMAASTQSVDITFEGEVIDKACTIDLHNGGHTMQLGTMSTQDERGSLVPMILKFSDCKNLTPPNAQQQMTANKIELVADLIASNVGKVDLKKGTLTTDKDNVLVQIYKNKTAGGDTDKGLVEGMKFTQADKAQLVTVGYVRMEKNGAGALTPGKVQAKAMFKVTYN